VLPAPRVATAAASEVEIATAPTTTALAATTTAPPASPTTTPITTALAALETPTPAALDMDLFQILIGQINKINELFGFHKSFSFLSEMYVARFLNNYLWFSWRLGTHEPFTKKV
jgi:hypothetical protein